MCEAHHACYNLSQAPSQNSRSPLMRSLQRVRTWLPAPLQQPCGRAHPSAGTNSYLRLGLQPAHSVHPGGTPTCTGASPKHLRPPPRRDPCVHHAACKQELPSRAIPSPLTLEAGAEMKSRRMEVPQAVPECTQPSHRLLRLATQWLYRQRHAGLHTATHPQEMCTAQLRPSSHCRFAAPVTQRDGRHSSHASSAQVL